MGIVAISTVEIKPAKGSAAVLKARLNRLLVKLNRPGCAAYSLTCGSYPESTWVITGIGTRPNAWPHTSTCHA
jgi:N-formylglutamate amidohydrolase